jgi:hypothetical protein
VNLMIAVLYGFGLFGLARLRHHMRKHTGLDGQYQAPL